jgi:hypothetical protein
MYVYISGVLDDQMIETLFRRAAELGLTGTSGDRVIRAGGVTVGD